MELCFRMRGENKEENKNTMRSIFLEILERHRRRFGNKERNQLTLYDSNEKSNLGSEEGEEGNDDEN